MKNLKYILITIVFSLTFISCEDDSEIDYSLSGTEESVQVTIETPRNFTAEEDRVPFTVTLANTYSSDATVVVEFKFNDERFIRNEVIIPAGNNSASGKVFMPADDGALNTPGASFKAGFVVGKVVGFLLDEPQEGKLYIVNSNEVLLDAYDKLPTLVDGGGLSYTFTWRTNKTDDYDIFSDLSDLDSATGDSIETGSVTNDAFADGDYNMVYNPYAVAGVDDVEFVLFFRVTDIDGNDQVYKFTGTLDAVNNDPAVNYDLIQISRVTDAGTGAVSFSFNQLED